MRHPGTLPATAEPVTPKRGMRFMHTRLAGSDNKHCVCHVTAVRKGRVYYASHPDLTKANWHIDVDKFPTIVAEILPDQEQS